MGALQNTIIDQLNRHANEASRHMEMAGQEYLLASQVKQTSTGIIGDAFREFKAPSTSEERKAELKRLAQRELQRTRHAEAQAVDARNYQRYAKSVRDSAVQATKVTEEAIILAVVSCKGTTSSGPALFMPHSTVEPVGAADLQFVARKLGRRKVLEVTGSLAREPRVGQALPPNKTKKGSVAPQLVGERYTYEDNDENRQSLGNFQRCVDQINQRLGKDATVVRADAPFLTRPKSNGILGWDVRCDIPDWVAEQIPILQGEWNPRLNPKIKNGKFTFGKCSAGGNVVSKVLRYVKQNSQIFQSVYPGQIRMHYSGKHGVRVTKRSVRDTVELTGLDDPENRLEKFLDSDSTVTQLSVGSKHYFVYKDTDTGVIYVYDPQGRWSGMKTMMSQLREYVSTKGWRISFRMPVSNQDGSCRIMALVRVLMMAQYGVAGAMMDVPCFYPIVVARLITKLR